MERKNRRVELTMFDLLLSKLLGIRSVTKVTKIVETAHPQWSVYKIRKIRKDKGHKKNVTG